MISREQRRRAARLQQLLVTASGGNDASRVYVIEPDVDESALAAAVRLHPGVPVERIVRIVRVSTAPIDSDAAEEREAELALRREIRREERAEPERLSAHADAPANAPAVIPARPTKVSVQYPSRSRLDYLLDGSSPMDWLFADPARP
jgi:hypothetical protein